MREARRSEFGFTLLELMIVLGMVSILLSILVLGIRQASVSFDLRRASSVAVAEVRRAQSAASGEGVDHTVEFAVGTGTSVRLNIYRVAALSRSIDIPEEWPESVSFSADTSPPPGGAALPLCGSPGTRAGVGSSSNTCIWFRFLGAPDSVGGQPVGTIQLQSRSGTIWRIMVAAGTGRVSLQK